jgi:glycosyltransferase involved in cell wall biosynthesis
MLVGIDASRACVSQRTGTENYSLNLIRALGKIDQKNRYRLYLRGERLKVKGERGNLHLTPNTLNLTDLPENFEKKVISLSRLWTQVGLAWEVLRNPPDLLFVPAHTLPAIAVTLRHWKAGLPVIRQPSLKTIVTIHDLGAEFLPFYHTFFGREYLLFATKYAVKNASALIAVSQATKKDLIEKLGADPEKIYVVYEGVDHERFKVQGERGKVEKVLKKYNISQPYFLFVGTVQPRKNLEKLIQAFSLLVHSSQFTEETIKKSNSTNYEPRTLNLVIVGKRGWLYDRIYQTPARFGVKDRVKFLNYVNGDDLPALYSGCLAFVLPSLVEGFGLPALEAMACGAPVILSKTSSLPEIGGDAAIYIDPYCTKNIADNMAKVLDLSLREKLRAKSLAQAQKFSWEKCATQTLEVFEGVQRGQR